MSECTICGRAEAMPDGCWRTVPGIAEAAECFRIGYEREKARADHESKLLTAALDRANELSGEVLAERARAEQWALREAALVEAGIRREAEWLSEHQALTRQAAQARAALERGMERHAKDMLAPTHSVCSMCAPLAEALEALRALAAQPHPLPIDNANASGAPSARSPAMPEEER